LNECLFLASLNEWPFLAWVLKLIRDVKGGVVHSLFRVYSLRGIGACSLYERASGASPVTGFNLYVGLRLLSCSVLFVLPCNCLIDDSLESVADGREFESFLDNLLIEKL
jgi:hypothetical protein